MSTLFPKRTFTSDDMSLTLLDLQLVPSASIIILPVSYDHFQHVMFNDSNKVYNIK